jgi:hypothetical protein
MTFFLDFFNSWESREILHGMATVDTGGSFGNWCPIRYNFCTVTAYPPLPPTSNGLACTAGFPRAENLATLLQKCQLLKCAREKEGRISLEDSFFL